MLLFVLLQILKIFRSIITAALVCLLTIHRILILQISFVNLKYEMTHYYIHRKRNLMRNRGVIPFRIREDSRLNNVLDYSVLYLFGFLNFVVQIILITPILNRLFGSLIRRLTKLPIFVRRLISFVFGIGLSYFLFAVFSAKDSRKSLIIIFTIVIVTLFTFVFAISTAFRCIILLAIPKIIITQLRFIILYQISILIISGPLVTIQANSQILCELVLCAAKISYDITMEKVREATKPLLVFVHSFRVLVNEFSAFYKTMKSFLSDALHTIREMQKYLESFLIGISRMLKMCEQKLSKIARECSNLMYSVETSCLTFFDYVPLLGLLCYITRLLLPFCNSFYLTAQMCKVGYQFTDKMSRHFKHTIDQFRAFLDEIFYVKLDVKYVNKERTVKSDSLDRVFHKIAAAIEARFDLIHLGLSTKMAISVLILAWVLYSSYAYRKKFLKYDNFDNTYITKDLNRIDNKRALHNLETIFPLYPEEKLRYLTRDSIFLSKTELIDILKNYLILLLFTFQMISICLLDFLIYSIANIFTKLLNEYSKQDQHMFYVEQTDGNEPNMLIESINNATNLEALAPIKSLLECKKNDAFYPLTGKYKLILFYLLVLCLIYFTRGYLRRSLSLICSFYYPERGNKRNIHLYLTILRTRANIFLFLARGLKQAVFRDKTAIRVNLWERILANHPTLTLWLTRLKLLKKKDFCNVCGRPGLVDEDKEKLNKSPDRLYPCTNELCKSTYCLACAMEHGFKCLLCNARIIKKHKGLKPLQKEQTSDSSEVSDSGEEWQPFYFESEKLGEGGDDQAELTKLNKKWKQLPRLKRKEEKRFAAYLCSSEETVENWSESDSSFSRLIRTKSKKKADSTKRKRDC